MVDRGDQGGCIKAQAGDCGTCHERPQTEWSELTPEDTAFLSSAKQARSYASGQSLFMQGEANSGLHCLNSGTVALRQLDESGNSVLLGLAYPGDVLGYRSLVAGEDHKTSAEALGPCAACKIDRRTAEALMNRCPQIGLAFLRRSSREIQNLHDSLVRSAVMNNRGRLLHVMVSLMEHHGETTEDGSHTINLPVSRRDLASMIGTRHETLSRVMSRLEKEELAHFSGRRVVIPDWEALVDAANSSQAA